MEFAKINGKKTKKGLNKQTTLDKYYVLCPKV